LCFLEDKSILIEMEKKYISNKTSPQEYGKGHRKHVPKVLTDSESSDVDERKGKKVEKKPLTSKECKKQEELETARCTLLYKN
jgi:hypothetical protein